MKAVTISEDEVQVFSDAVVMEQIRDTEKCESVLITYLTLRK